MATITRALTCGLKTNKEADVEEVTFRPGDTVDVVKEWDRFFLVKDEDGHFYNLPKDAVEP